MQGLVPPLEILDLPLVSKQYFQRIDSLPVADAGFPRRDEGCQRIINFYQKLHEMKKKIDRETLDLGCANDHIALT